MPIEVLDNTEGKRLGDSLRATLDDDAKLSIISAHVSLFAFGELREELERLDSVRVLFNEPTFISDMERLADVPEFDIARRAQCERERALADSDLELSLRNKLNQRALARACASWLREKVTLRSVRREHMFQHPPTYVIEGSGVSPHLLSGQGATFTLEGLGVERRPDTLTMITHCAGDEAKGLVAFLMAQFESVWADDALTCDVTEQVASKVEALHTDNAPEFIYFLTLYHIFRRFLQENQDHNPREDTGFFESVIWDKLYDFQKDAVIGAIRKLEKYNGCIIADSVGLGKTFEALAIIKYYQQLNKNVLVLCPKRLRENWTLWTQASDERNPLAKDRFAYKVLNHTDLSRRRGKSGDTDLEHLQWGTFDLVVIDESHNFRNRSATGASTNRYTRLMNEVIRANGRTKVLMLSATPINNRLADLRHQIELITEGRDDYLEKTDGITSIDSVMRLAQKRFNLWSSQAHGRHTTQSFAEYVNADYFRLLDALTIARSRKHVAKYYGAETGTFPTRLTPRNVQVRIDSRGELPPIGVLYDMISDLTFAQYQLLSYVREDARPAYEADYREGFGNDFGSELHRTNAVAVLMRVNLLKRMESSVSAFRSTLGRVRSSCADILGRLAALDARDTNDVLACVDVGYGTEGLDDGLDDRDAEMFEVGAQIRVDLRDVDCEALSADLSRDIEILDELIGYARAVTPDRDAKLGALRTLIAEKTGAGQINPGNRKILVFSAFADTATYLYDQLAPELLRTHGLTCAQVTGTCNRVTGKRRARGGFEDILGRFSPRSKETIALAQREGEIDIVVATDCISEGQNLQDCDCVVNYDVHWNPVRIVQRFGRIDRLGSSNKHIQMVTFWPDVDLESYIKLESRVKARMALGDASASGEENLLTPSEDMNDLEYRSEQLRALRSETLDLEDMRRGMSITDFTLDDYRIELERYMNANPGALEGAATGLYAVVSIPDDLRDQVRPGVIFCLQQRDGTSDASRAHAPLSLIYVPRDAAGTPALSHPTCSLDLLRRLCEGHREPLEALCAQFDRATRDGEDMSEYSAMLTQAVAAAIRQGEEATLESLFTPGAIAQGASSEADFSLVSFVVLL